MLEYRPNIYEILTVKFPFRNEKFIGAKILTMNQLVVFSYVVDVNLIEVKSISYFKGKSQFIFAFIFLTIKFYTKHSIL